MTVYIFPDLKKPKTYMGKIFSSPVFQTFSHFSSSFPYALTKPYRKP